jgi:hypothetical protein
MSRNYRSNTTKTLTLASTLFGIVSLAAVPASALAGTATTTATSGSASVKQTDANQAKITVIITRGDTEISRRLTSLSGLSTKISAATKLNASDKATLSDEVSTEVSGLTNLKTKLDADTDITTARTDAQSVITDYRVYALITPKIALIKTADDQQVAETKLSDLVTKLQGKATTSATQSQLADMASKVQAAQTISANIESTVVGLQPTDYNSNHAVLDGDRNQLVTAQTDIKAAAADAKSIIASIKTSN